MAVYSHYYNSPQRWPSEPVSLAFPLDANPDWTLTDVHFPPRLSNGKVFLSSGDGLISAFDEETAQPQWEFRLPAPENQEYHPDILISGDSLLTRRDRDLFVLDAGTGALRRRHQAGYFDLRSAAFANESLFCLDVDEDLNVACIRYDLASGQTIWKQPLMEVPEFLTVKGDVVLAPLDDSTLACFDCANGEIQWKSAVALTRGPILAWNDLAIVACQSEIVAGFEISSGTMRWKQRAKISSAYQMAADAAGTIHILQNDAWIQLSAERGVVRNIVNIEDAKRSRGMSILSAPTATEGHLLLADVYSGLLVAIENGSGEIVWSFPCAGKVPVHFAPVATRNRVFAVDSGGHFYAFRSLA
ncbi:MAG TPA: PQQ-binding-like beta-propeller repeat protein [Bryobacteraceae bacterium]|jgi:outer membrane protein assembly factor BamB|nr:PQQ-binding-like beta-propeller repeat protein [Bryobacteraceae bacterium]